MAQALVSLKMEISFAIKAQMAILRSQPVRAGSLMGKGPYDDVKKYEVDAFVGAIKRVGSEYFIYEAPSDNCSAMDHADEINDYVECQFR